MVLLIECQYAPEGKPEVSQITGQVCTLRRMLWVHYVLRKYREPKTNRTPPHGPKEHGDKEMGRGGVLGLMGSGLRPVPGP